MLYIGHTVHNSKHFIQVVEGIGLSNFCCKCGDTLVEMAESWGSSKVVEVQRLNATQSLVVAFSTDRTENLAVIIGQQLIEDMNAKITCSTCQKHITDWLTLTFTEILKTVSRKERIKRCKVFCLWGVYNRSCSLRS